MDPSYFGGIPIQDDGGVLLSLMNENILANDLLKRNAMLLSCRRALMRSLALMRANNIVEAIIDPTAFHNNPKHLDTNGHHFTLHLVDVYKNIIRTGHVYTYRDEIRKPMQTWKNTTRNGFNSIARNTLFYPREPRMSEFEIYRDVFPESTPISRPAIQSVQTQAPQQRHAQPPRSRPVIKPQSLRDVAKNTRRQETGRKRQASIERRKSPLKEVSKNAKYIPPFRRPQFGTSTFLQKLEAIAEETASTTIAAADQKENMNQAPPAVDWAAANGGYTP